MAPAAAMGKTIEEMYQKKTQLEHILLRPDTYIGSVEKHEQMLWVCEGDEEGAMTMVQRSVSYVPGLYKIFDEILVNAADNKQRDPQMDRLEVVIDQVDNLISVYNTGDGIPVEIHKEEGVYVPELIFGHLLTSSNYNDSEKKTTGGRNGYGAKLTNIFSTQFIIETADGRRNLKYKQVFLNNMGHKGDPQTQKCKTSENWTKVTFRPDLAKFNMTHLEDDVVALMKKRVIDMAGCLAPCPGKKVKVLLNGKEINIKSFHDYAQLYLDSANRTRDTPLPRIDNIKEDANPRWQISVSHSDGHFQQVSFVNSINTIKGGTHVDYITNQIIKRVIEVVKKKNKNANLKPHVVKNYLWIFVNALIDNPAFDSQTKETLTTRTTSFGTTCELSDKFLKKVFDGSGVVESLLSWAEYKQSKDLKKTDGSKARRVDVEKLEDAAEAGGSGSQECTLILTEGDSAKALAMAGISAVHGGRRFYGVFPLRGKLLNVREASSEQITKNHEIQNLKKILGLKQGEKYDKENSIKSLRYGHLMIMADQDHDGSHIKGLIINFVHTFWPSLLKHQSFMLEFITPIVKASSGKGKEKKLKSFYTMRDYEEWVKEMGDDIKKWTIKYYKGLGTSDANEGKEYFRDIEQHRKIFVWEDDKDGDAIELAFSKKKIEARKDWLREGEAEGLLNHEDVKIKYSDFVHKELKLFSRADLQRSIPSMVDGLKPTQRKVLFSAFKKNLVNEIKVAQFSGYVSEKSAYHHGEQSIQSTIVGMAQDFVGTNNINLLMPNGQFGTRNMGGKDAASARYIHTKLADITRFLFPKDDDVLLHYLKEDGLSIEPLWYMPVIPMVLVNGSEGIGTGWSTFIPNYYPRDIIANIRCLLKDEPLLPMDPWYNKFKGTIQKSATKESGITYTVTGTIEEVVEDLDDDVGIDDVQLRITELPIRKWSQDYKSFLGSLEKEGFIKKYNDWCTNDIVHLDVILSKKNFNLAVQEGLLKKLKLTTTISTSNMHLFDEENKIIKYESPEQILDKFFHLRLPFYRKRKERFLEIYQSELVKLENQVRFILGVVEGEIVVCKRKKAELVNELRDKGFTPVPKNTNSVVPAVVGATEDNEGAEESDEPGDNSENIAATSASLNDYDYLLSMAIGSLTIEKVKLLCANRDKVLMQIEELKKETEKSLWLKDLDALEKALDEKEKKEEEEATEAISMHRDSKKPGKVSRKNNRKATKAKSSVDTSNSVAAAGMETDNPPQKVDAKGRGGRKKAPPKKGKSSIAENEDEDDDDEFPDLLERLARHNLNSSPDNSAGMETDAPDAEVTKKGPRGASLKKSSTQVEDFSDDDDGNLQSETVAIQEAGGKKGRGKAAKSKEPKQMAGTKKRAPANKKSQKLITDSLKPSETSEISPEKKVRRMRPSPFNKKSGSVLNRDSATTNSMGSLEDLEKSVSALDSIEEVTEIAPAKPRPQRASRKQTTYVLSDSESEEAEQSSEDFSDSGFDEDD